MTSITNTTMLAHQRFHDMEAQMSSFQYAGPARHPVMASGRTFSGRIEKSRSQHNSPASDSRRRGYPMLRHTTPSQFNSSHSHFYAPRRAARPYSWGPSTASSIRAPSADYIISPAASNYTTTPAYQPYTSTPHQYSGIQATSLHRVHGDVAHYNSEAADRAPSITSASSCYSNASLSPPSPVWHQSRPETVMPALTTSSSSTYGSPEDLNSWRYPAQSQAQQIQSSLYYSPPSTLEQHQPSHFHDTSFAFSHASDYLLDRPPSPDLLWSGKKTHDDGEVLVALGLYDSPGSFDSPTTAPRKLKLAETWQPPKTVAVTKASSSSSESEDASEADEDAEDDDEEITFSKPEPGTSWFLH